MTRQPATLAQLEILRDQILEDLRLIYNAQKDKHEPAMQPVMLHLVGISRKGIKRNLVVMAILCQQLDQVEQPVEEAAATISHAA